jgi:formate-dependent nitrite reductase membrane component NrfD
MGSKLAHQNNIMLLNENILPILWITKGILVTISCKFMLRGLSGRQKEVCGRLSAFKARFCILSARDSVLSV